MVRCCLRLTSDLDLSYPLLPASPVNIHIANLQPQLQSWPAPNYEDPVTRGYTLVVINVILITFTITLVGARLYTRLCVNVWFGLDDIFILLALVRSLLPLKPSIRSKPG